MKLITLVRITFLGLLNISIDISSLAFNKEKEESYGRYHIKHLNK